jgi:hypothetical protein
MLQGDSFNCKLSVADCLNAVEFALVDQQFSYTPYTWQVVMSDSKKGRMLAVAKARPSSEEHPSFSLNVELTIQADKSATVSWSFDATHQCSATADLTNKNLLEYLKVVQENPAHAVPVASPPKQVETPKPTPFISSSRASQLGAESVADRRAVAPAPVTSEGEREVSQVRGMIPELRPSAPRSDYQRASYAAPAPSPTPAYVSSGVNRSANVESSNTAEPLSIKAWFRQFVLGESCPECQGPKELNSSGGCRNEYHRRLGEG